MPEQLSFAGFEQPALPTESVFLAILPDEATAVRIAHLAQRLRDKHGLTGRPLATRRFHVSLHYVAAHPPPRVVATASEAFEAVGMPPFRIAFDRVQSLGGKGRRNKPLVLSGGDGVAGLLQLQAQLGRAMEQAGLGRWIGPSWLPHLTLLYDWRDVKEEAVDPVSWDVRELVLVHSLPGRSRYDLLARWPLPCRRQG
jgi:2'-5' RNA ligase